MRQFLWWSPNGSTDSRDTPGTLLSYRWIQTFVFELPPLKRTELVTSLRYKVQATLPVNAEDFAFHTRLFRHGGKMYGAAFMATASAKDVLPAPARTLRVAVPLLLPKVLAGKVLLFVATPEGMGGHYYEEGLLKSSFAPIDPDDMELRARILARCPGAEIIGLAPDPKYHLPADLQEREPAESIRANLLDAFPFWDPPPPRRFPLVIAASLLAGGLAFCVIALWSFWSLREQRNETWRAWLKGSESLNAAPSYKEQTSNLLKAQGAPVPELFEHLANVWGSQTRIVELEWSQGKLTVTAESPSALASLRKLTADAWFSNIRVDDIRTQKDGTEVFTVGGSLALDY